MLGDIGGFSDAIVLICSILLGNYTPRLYLNSILKNVFKVDAEGDDSHHLPQKMARVQAYSDKISKLEESVKTSPTTVLKGSHLKEILKTMG